MINNNNKRDITYIPFALPDISDEEINQVANCMKSGWLTTGPKVKEFENNFANFIGNDVAAVSVNSATSGLILVLEALGIKEGDEVITTAFTFSATAMSIVHIGATPIFVDINPNTMNIDPNKIEEAITSNTKAIIPVHFAGLSCDMDKIIKIAKKNNLYIIEDAAHALPATYNGKIIGSLDTDATIYSFYATKTITTGEGGMIVTKNKTIANRCRIMRLHGISTDVFDRYTSTKPKWYYEIIAAGYKCNMTDIAAAIGIPQLGKANQFQKKRQYIHDIYCNEFKNLPVKLPAEPQANDIHSWHLFTIQLTSDSPIGRDDFINKMSNDYAIGCSVHFIPLHLHPYWKHKTLDNYKNLKNSESVFNNIVSLPIYTKMTDEQIERVVTATKKVLT